MFLTTFEPQYRRVNKVNNRNLRCFPMHSCGGHYDQGFCGQSVTFFCPVVVPGTTFLASFVIKDAPTTSLLPGEGVFLGEIAQCNRVIFNGELHGWHYAWSSTRHTACSLHCLRVCISEPGYPPVFVDSSPFVVSAFRLRDDPDDSLRLKARNQANGHVRVIFHAIRERLDLSEDEDQAWDTVGGRMDWAEASPDVWIDEPLMDDVDVQKLLSMDQLDRTLARASDFIHARFATFKNFAELSVALARFLQESENTTISAVACQVQRLVGTPALAASLINVFSGVDEFFASASQELACMLPPGESFVREFCAANDLTGSYLTPIEVRGFIEAYREKSGWSALELSIHSSYVASLQIKIVGPRQGVLIKALRDVGLVQTSTVFTLGIPKRADAMSSGVIHHPWGGVGCSWAHGKGVCFVMCNEEPGVRMLSVLSRDEDHPGALVGKYRLQRVEEGGRAWVSVANVEAVLKPTT
jgi:hypothetical protein